jgi:predicted AAA+ superfamily ATPase
MTDEKAILATLDRLAAALERMAPRPAPAFEFAAAEAFVWQTSPQAFLPVAHVNRQPLGLLKGIMLDNTRRFARAYPPTTPCCKRAAWASRRW